jgi:glycine dehydrogenase subunit 1
MADLGEAIFQRTRYAMQMINKIDGLRVPFLETPHYREFVVNFDKSGKTVKQVNESLLERGIFGGKDLSRDFPELGQSGLYCVTEIHSQADLDRLAGALTEVIR